MAAPAGLVVGIIGLFKDRGKLWAIAGAVVAAAAGAFFFLFPSVLKCLLGIR